jgi:hypothetical protein
VASAAYQQKILLIIRFGQSLKQHQNKTPVSVTFKLPQRIIQN